MTDPRGNWTIHEGIAAHWNLHNLDENFKQFWPDPTETRFIVLDDGEAQENPPGPYCVYEVTPQGEPIRMTGSTVRTERELITNLVEFRIHAKSKPNSVQSAKEIVRDLAKEVVRAFDDMTALCVSPDFHVLTIREVDFGVREGEREYRWVVPYTITIDAEYDTSALYV